MIKLTPNEFVRKVIDKGERDFTGIEIEEGSDFSPYINEIKDYMGGDIHPSENGLKRSEEYDRDGGIKLGGSKLKRIKAKGLYLKFVNCKGVDFSESDFSYGDFLGNFEYSSFIGTNLTKTQMAGLRASCSIFYRAILQGTKFGGANFYSAILNHAIGDRIYFYNAKFNKADVSGLNGFKTSFYEADLRGVRNLEKMLNIQDAVFYKTKIGKSEEDIIFRLAPHLFLEKPERFLIKEKEKVPEDSTEKFRWMIRKISDMGLGGPQPCFLDPEEKKHYLNLKQRNITPEDRDLLNEITDDEKELFNNVLEESGRKFGVRIDKQVELALGKLETDRLNDGEFLDRFTSYLKGDYMKVMMDELFDILSKCEQFKGDNVTEKIQGTLVEIEQITDILSGSFVNEMAKSKFCEWVDRKKEKIKSLTGGKNERM